MLVEKNLEAIVEEYADMVRRICFMHLKNREDTEDIFQNVFLKYYLYQGEFQSKEHEKAWIIRITINACKDLLKSFFRKNISSIDDIKEEFVCDSHRELLNVVLSLPTKYRDVIYLHYYEDYTAAEISKIINKNENTISSLLSRGRKMLKDKLGGEWNE